MKSDTGVSLATSGGVRLLVGALVALGVCFGLGAPAFALDKEEMRAILKELDDRQRSSGDYQALVFIDAKEKGKTDVAYEAVIYRRDDDDKLVILFLKPKSESGKGYLRIDNNLFLYDPTVGKWERRTERERIGGTGGRRNDFDESRLAEEYDPEYVGEEKLGKFGVYHLKLVAKKDANVAYPILHLWVDKETKNMLKAQDVALSGRLMRTSYYPKWQKLYSEDKKADIYFPREIQIYDEVEKGNKTVIVMRAVDLKPLDKSIFTKAWLESKSR